MDEKAKSNMNSREKFFISLSSIFHEESNGIRFSDSLRLQKNGNFAVKRGPTLTAGKKEQIESSPRFP